jgi:AcrR family transcriptional regulator
MVRHTTPGSATVRRRERERVARRDDILRAAREVFGSRGFQEATLDEVASRAELAKGTLYNYFRNKEEIFRQIVADLLDDVLAMAEAAAGAGHPPREAFQTYAEQVMTYYMKHGDVLRIVAREMFRLEVEGGSERIQEFHHRVQEIVAVLSTVLDAAPRTGARVRPTPHELTQMFISIVHHRTIRWLFHEHDTQELDPHEESQLLTKIFFDGAASV